MYVWLVGPKHFDRLSGGFVMKSDVIFYNIIVTVIKHFRYIYSFIISGKPVVSFKHTNSLGPLQEY